jgi:hypothetical protein
MKMVKYPMDCIFFPQCESLKELVRDIPRNLKLTKSIVLQKRAESFCAECVSFERRPIKTVA